MVGRRKTLEHVPHIKKFLDHSRDPLKRLKALRIALDKAPAEDVKPILTKHSSIIFYVIYASFTSLETTINERSFKGKGVGDQMKEVLDVVLPSLEKVMVYLPELLHDKWQYNSICIIIRKLLHPQNHCDLRIYGLKLLVLWLQALQDNACDAALELFASAVPHFPPKMAPIGVSASAQDIFPESSSGSVPYKLSERYGTYAVKKPTGPDSESLVQDSKPPPALTSLGRHKDWVSPATIYPLWPATANSDDSLSIMDFLLTCLTEQVGRLKWNDPSKHLKGFSFIFFQFKLFYLACLYKKFRSDVGLYSPNAPPELRSDNNSCSTIPEEPVSSDLDNRSLGTRGLLASSAARVRGKHTITVSAVIKLDHDTSDPIYSVIRHLILRFVLKWIMPDFHSNRPGSIQPKLATPSPFLAMGEQVFIPSRAELMRDIWFSSRDNINLLLEICNQGFQLPHSTPALVNKLTELYRKWVMEAEKPLFMHIPPERSLTLPGRTDAAHIAGASTLSVVPWEIISKYEGFDSADVRAGFQPSVKIFVAHTSQLFQQRNPDKNLLQSQVDSGKRIISFYQELARRWILDKDGWEYLLAVLLNLTVSLLEGTPPVNRDCTLGGHLAESIMQTLFVCYIRASMTKELPKKLWDDLVAVVSPLTRWKEVVTQWKEIMHSMTQTLARVVYQLDLENLPLDQLGKDNHHSYKPGRPRAGTSTSDHEGWKTPRMAFSNFQPKPPRSSPAHSRQLPTKNKSSPALRNIKMTAESVDESCSPQMILSQQLKEEEVRRQSTPTVPSKAFETTSLQTVPTTVEVEEIACSESKALLEPCPSGIKEETKVSRTASPRKHKGYQKLKLQEGDSPPDENVIENVHILSPSLESEKGVTLSLMNDGQEPDNNRVVSSNATASGDRISFHLEEGQRRSQAEAGDHHSDDLIISNSDAVTGVDDVRSLDQSPYAVKDNDDLHSRSLADVEPTSYRHRRLRKSQSWDLSLFRLAQSDSRANLQQRSKSPDASNHSCCPVSVSSKLSPLDTFSEFVPEVKSSPGSSGSGGPMTPPICSTPITKTSVLSKVQDTPSTIHEEGEVECKAAEHVFEEEMQVSLPHPQTLPRPSPREQHHRRHSSVSPSQEGSWTAVNAAIVWQRMLCILGDVNSIENPIIHHDVMRGLWEIWILLNELEKNSGISLDSQSTPLLPEFMPPMMLIFPWVAKACVLPVRYKNGRQKAYELLCNMALRHSCSGPSSSILPHFYRLMHLGLQPTSGVLHDAVKFGCRLFSYGLPGSSVLLHDCLVACSHILNSRSTEAPRMETLTLLGSMLYILGQYGNLSLPVPVSEGDSVLGDHLKLRLVGTLFDAARREPHRNSRCLALYQVGMLACSEINCGTPSRNLLEGIDIILASLEFQDMTVAMTAVDMLTLLSEVATSLKTLFSSLPVKILQCLCASIAGLLQQTADDRKHKLVIAQMHCLRDWLMALPVQAMAKSGSLSIPIINSIFQVLHAAVTVDDRESSWLASLDGLSSPVNVTLDKLDLASVKPSRSTVGRTIKKADGSGAILGTSDGVEQIITAARAVLTHLMNLLGHFPFPCGAAQMTSIVCEFHDSPSLQYLDEISSDLFYSPRVQFFSLNDSAIVTYVEIPLPGGRLPSNITTADYQCRVIVRDVTGKYSWDAAILYGPVVPSASKEISSVLVKAESVESLQSMVEDSERSSSSVHPDIPNLPSFSVDPLQPPTWKTHRDTSHDLLCDLLGHLESTSPECLLVPGVGLAGPDPAVNEFTDHIETNLRSMIEQQHQMETRYHLETSSLACMRLEPVGPPTHFQNTLPFLHCRLFLSHLGLLSWERRNSLDLLEKNEQLVRELKHLDASQTQCRQTYKIAVMYMACGQEDKTSILSNTMGSQAFEQFVAGLGWEVDLETHAGYMGGLKRSHCVGCTMPYYSTSSEEILFHVSTRMPSRGGSMLEKIRHLGNDEVHIVWSEHWRDYRRTLFRTEFADIVIVIYPLPNNLYRIQIDKKNNILFGPLFDGAVVDQANLPFLVRATSINAFRALRSLPISYRGRHLERFKYIKDVIKLKNKACQESFAQGVIHPLESSTPSATRHVLSPAKHPTFGGTTQLTSPSQSQTTIKGGSNTASLPRISATSSTPETRWALSPRVSSLLKLPGSSSRLHVVDAIETRPRSHTNEEHVLSAADLAPLVRNHSVPDNIGRDVQDEGRVGHGGSITPSPSKLIDKH